MEVFLFENAGFLSRTACFLSKRQISCQISRSALSAGVLLSFPP